MKKTNEEIEEKVKDPASREHIIFWVIHNWLEETGHEKTVTAGELKELVNRLVNWLEGH